jgi:hypothetical protein
VSAKNPDPLGDFNVTDYEPETEFVTIAVHRSLFKNPKSMEAAAKKAQEIILAGPSVKGVKFEPR